jgi:hypothetical protein
MDIEDTQRLGANLSYSYWETDRRRNEFERYWNGPGALILEDAGNIEDVRDALRREERMAQACYEI